jgi:DNA-directed RNA polymerase subunit M/transcription elongation factor TFIIS
MKEITNKKECPKCGSNDVTYQGTSSGTGSASEYGPSPSVDKHDFKCNACGHRFYYTGRL